MAIDVTTIDERDAVIAWADAQASGRRARCLVCDEPWDADASVHRSCRPATARATSR